jgi:hypothetical protein
MVYKNIFAALALRLAIALSLFVAVYWQVNDRMMHNLFRPAEYFSYFSITSSLLAGLILTLSSIQLVRGRAETKLLSLSRLTMAVSMVIVGVIYNALLRGGDPDPRDANYDWPVIPNEIIHTYVPILILVEWLFTRTTIALKLNQAFWVLVYPLSWLAVSIIRGIIQVWWPYWFIDPKYGLGTQVMWIFIIAALFSVLSLGFLPAQRALAKRK